MRLQDGCGRRPGALRFALVGLCLAALVACNAPVATPPVPYPRATASPVARATAAATLPPATATTAVATPGPSATPFMPVNGPAAAAHYTMTVDLDYVGHSTQVTQTMRVRNNSRSAWEQLVLQVPPSRREGVFVLERVVVEGAAAGYEADADTATYAVTLAQPLAPGSAVSLELAYRLDLPRTSFGAWFPAGNLGYGDRVTQFNNWYPALVPYRDGQGWYTWPWADVGDPFVTEVADYDLEVRAAPDVVIAGGGPAAAAPGVTRFHLERARGIAFAASPEYRVAQDTADGVTLYSYYLAGHEAAGEAVLATMAQSIRLFGRLYGPYPYATFTMAENAFLGSMEYSAFVSHSGDQYAKYDGAPNSYLVTLTAHETSHQWWYGVVGSDQAYEPWLDEALASYSETVYYCEVLPDFCDSSRAQWGERAGHGALDRTIYDFTSSATYLHALYPLGGQFVMVLHDTLGGERFYEFLRDWRARGAYRLAGAREFIALLGTYMPEGCAPLVIEYFPGLTALRAETLLSPEEAAAALCSGIP